MSNINLSLNYKPVGLTLAFSIASILSYFPQLFARGAKPTANNPDISQVTYEVTKAPTGTGTATKTLGTGDRKGGACPDVNIPLTALTPAYKKPDGNFLWGKTLDERPTFWVYVPYSLTDKRPGELRLRETKANGGTVLKSVATVTGTSPGVIGVRLPIGKTLKPNEMNFWQFVVRCDPDDASSNQFVSSTVTLVQPSAALAKQLKQATPKQKVAIYAKEEYWYDYITILGGLRKANPRDAEVNKAWQNLLHSINHDNIADKPIGG